MNRAALDARRARKRFAESNRPRGSTAGAEEPVAPPLGHSGLAYPTKVVDNLLVMTDVDVDYQAKNVPRHIDFNFEGPLAAPIADIIDNFESTSNGESLQLACDTAMCDEDDQSVEDLTERSRVHGLAEDGKSAMVG